MKTLLSTTAVALALMTTPVLAQTATTPSAAQSSTTAPSTTAPSTTAPSTTASPSAASTQPSEQDRTFATKAAQGGMAEVELGRVAASKASSADVKQFGQKMVDDHTRTNEKLKALAERKQITLPTDLDAEHKQAQAQLSTLTGDQFDRQYMRMMVMDHQKTIDLFRTQANSGSDADLKSFAQQTLPALEQHLKMAQDMSRSLQPVASTGGAASTATAAATSTTPTVDTKLGQMTAKDLIGKDVVNARGQEVGEIENVVMGTDRTVHAVIGVGGFLGLGEKDVMLPVHQLRVGSDEAILMSDMSEDALKQLPEYKKDGFEELPRDRRIVE